MNYPSTYVRSNKLHMYICPISKYVSNLFYRTVHSKLFVLHYEVISHSISMYTYKTVQLKSLEMPNGQWSTYVRTYDRTKWSFKHANRFLSYTRTVRKWIIFCTCFNGIFLLCVFVILKHVRTYSLTKVYYDCNRMYVQILIGSDFQLGKSFPIISFRS